MSGHPTTDEIRLARERADLARARFVRRLDRLQNRLSPARIKDEAADAMRVQMLGRVATLRRALWQRPLLTGGIFAAIIAILFRRPLARLARESIRLGRLVRDWHRQRQELTQHDDEA